MALADARTLRDGAELRGDICIVGAGAAGLSLALRLRDSGLRVLLLEGGGLSPTPSAQDLYAGEMAGIDTWGLTQKRTRMFGGTTQIWSGWCMPMNPDDFEARRHLPDGAWPIRLADIEPYHDAAADLFEIARGAWDADARAAEGIDGFPGGSALLEVRLYRFSPPTQFGIRYRDDIERARDIRAFLHASVTGIETTASGHRVNRLQGRVQGGGAFTAVADRYVLCMGGIENARLLLASRGRSPRGVANSSGLVGRCFMEHPHFYDSAGWMGPADVELPSPGDRDAGDPSLPRVAGVVGLTAEARRSEGLLDCMFALELPAPSGESGSMSPPPQDIDALLAGLDKTSFRRITLRAEQRPDLESRVTLLDTVDALGMPRVRLDWRISDRDRESYARSVELVGRELGARGLGRTWYPADDSRRLSWRVGSGGHHMGTTRMGASASDGVVDGQCRTFDVENLYVAGSSVFRTGGSANPTFTLVALALRLADHLKGGRA